MDRLHTLILLSALLAAGGCDSNSDDDTTESAPPSRVVSVAAQAQADPAEGFCDAAPSGADAPALALPELGHGTAPTGARARWLNVWATWCEPCVEELPMLVEWRDRLTAEGVDVELVLLSADADDETVASFRQAHPDVPESLRVAEPTAIAEWAPSVGLDEGATLPVHVLTNAQGRVACARTGAIRETDFDAVKAILSR